MTRFFSLTGVVVCCLLLSEQTPRAQERPSVTPTRDVDVTYDVTRPDQPTLSKRVRWRASEHMERVDGPDGSATIFDHRRNEITLVNPASRTFLQLDGAARQPPHLEAGAILQRGDISTVAGLHCSNWTWTEDVETHTACLTGDGVLLRLVVDGGTILRARSAAYSPQKADLFDVPASYAPALAPAGLIP